MKRLFLFFALLLTVCSTAIAQTPTLTEVAAIELGGFIIEQNGPVIEVVGEDGQTIKLYNPKKVNFIKVTSNE